VFVYLGHLLIPDVVKVDPREGAASYTSHDDLKNYC
jgi:hypothetical protein